MIKLKICQGKERTAGERKKELRAYMKKRRADNANRDVKEGLLVENFFRLLSELFPQTSGAGMQRSVFVYLDFSSEAPTGLLIERLQEAGYAVLSPRLEGKEMVAVAYGEDFTLSSFRIREPVGEAFAGDIDLIVAPLLAVDGQGRRLGYGGGYYDRFFKRYPQAKRVGYAFDFQIVGQVPAEAWDERLEWVVTDEQILKTE